MKDRAIPISNSKPNSQPFRQRSNPGKYGPILTN